MSEKSIENRAALALASIAAPEASSATASDESTPTPGEDHADDLNNGINPENRVMFPKSYNKDLPICANCFTQTTPLWRRSHDSSHILCNACALFFKMKGKPRPISLKTDVIKSRNRSRSKNAAGKQRDKKREDEPTASPQSNGNSLYHPYQQVDRSRSESASRDPSFKDLRDPRDTSYKDPRDSSFKDSPGSLPPMSRNYPYYTTVGSGPIRNRSSSRDTHNRSPNTAVKHVLEPIEDGDEALGDTSDEEMDVEEQEELARGRTVYRPVTLPPMQVNPYYGQPYGYYPPPGAMTDVEHGMTELKFDDARRPPPMTQYYPPPSGYVVPNESFERHYNYSSGSNSNSAGASHSPDKMSRSPGNRSQSRSRGRSRTSGEPRTLREASKTSSDSSKEREITALRAKVAELTFLNNLMQSRLAQLEGPGRVPSFPVSSNQVEPVDESSTPTNDEDVETLLRESGVQEDKQLKEKLIAFLKAQQ